MEIRGKTALVTGGADRVGRAITLALAEAGANVVVHYHRSVKAAEVTAAQVQQAGAQALLVQADLAEQAGAQAVAQAAQERFGGADILIHAASPFVRSTLAGTTPETWRQVTGVLVEGFLWLAQRLAPGMVERGEGVIVAILDRGVFDPWPGFLAHSVGKSALWALARNLAVELAPQVRVNGVAPGPVLPPPGYTEAQRARIAAGTLLNRWGRPRDVADAVLYLVRADYVTGEILVVDGGERWAHRR